MVGRTFGRYRMHEEIGRGGMGVVYRALDIRLGRPVAIKVLGEKFRSLPAAWGMVLREAQIISALNHPSICTIYDAGEEQKQPYIAMEYVEGCALNALLAPSGLKPTLIAHASRQILSGLAHAHERGIIHRDVKCPNVMITSRGDLKILDFGLARHIRRAVAEGASRLPTSSMDFGALAGTVHYLAPEVLRGERASVWTDIWSFGVMLYEMATGHLPFRGSTVFELATSIMTSHPIPPRRKIPVWVAHIIARCLNGDIGSRYHCVRDILMELPDRRMADRVDMSKILDGYRGSRPRAPDREAAAAA